MGVMATELSIYCCTLCQTIEICRDISKEKENITYVSTSLWTFVRWITYYGVAYSTYIVNYRSLYVYLRLLKREIGFDASERPLPSIV